MLCRRGYLLDGKRFPSGVRLLSRRASSEVALAGAETRLVLLTSPGQEDRIGTFSNVGLECDDIQATYEELRGRDVEFTKRPPSSHGVCRRSSKMWTATGSALSREVDAGEVDLA